jgi:hypothetical protein
VWPEAAAISRGARHDQLAAAGQSVVTRREFYTGERRSQRWATGPVGYPGPAVGGLGGAGETSWLEGLGAGGGTRAPGVMRTASSPIEKAVGHGRSTVCPWEIVKSRPEVSGRSSWLVAGAATGGARGVGGRRGDQLAGSPPGARTFLFLLTKSNWVGLHYGESTGHGPPP